jgi:peptide/nickel transport system substrate-binding protein
MSEEFDTGEKNEDGTPKMANRMIEGSLERVDDPYGSASPDQARALGAEDLYNYPTVIMHRNFKPPFDQNPIGTGHSPSPSSPFQTAAS